MTKLRPKSQYLIFMQFNQGDWNSDKDLEIIVGMLYRGETQLSRSLEMLLTSFKESKYTRITIYIVSWMENLSGHLKLYGIFNQNLYNDRMKVDSDMILSNYSLDLISKNKKTHILFSLI